MYQTVASYTVPATSLGQIVTGPAAATYLGTTSGGSAFASGTAPFATSQGYQYAGQSGTVVIAAAPAASADTGAAVGGIAPATPIVQAVQPGAIGGAYGNASGLMVPGVPRTITSMATPITTTGSLTREQVLEQRVRELELALGQKDHYIKELQFALNKAGVKVPGGPGGMTPSPSGVHKKGATVAAPTGGSSATTPAARTPGRSASGFRKVQDSKPKMRYAAVDQEDPIDLRLEEFYNSTGSAIQFRRINRGFYRFGDSICELDIINHKLMARTEDGWNRGKFGPVEKFLMYYENIEREKAGILLEA